MAAEGGRVGWLSQYSVYRFQHTGEITVDVAVPEPQSAKARPRELAVAGLIASLMRIEIVLTAVDLDDELMLQTNEVDNESLARRLSAKVIAARSPRAEVNPNFHLLWSHRLA